MKTLVLAILLIAAPLAPATNFYSYVVKPSDGSIRLTVNSRRYIKILTFTAEGPADCTSLPGGISCNGISITAQLAGQPAVRIADGPLTNAKELFVAGPAYVTVTTNTTQTLFVTLMQDSSN